jgi:catechol 2,3-dioxygenase-like lactoylglutathione lyase family enzyme
MSGSRFKIIEHQNIRMIVEDIDRASQFYARAFGAVEMQRHVGTTEPALVRWFGETPETLSIDIGLSFVPNVLTLEFYKLNYLRGPNPGPGVDAHTTPGSGRFRGYGLGPQGIVVSDIEAAYRHFAYGGFDIQLSGPPLQYSSLARFGTGASPTSAARGEDSYLQHVANVWEDRINFHFSDPMGIHWTVSNNVV